MTCVLISCRWDSCLTHLYKQGNFSKLYSQPLSTPRPDVCLLKYSTYKAKSQQIIYQENKKQQQKKQEQKPFSLPGQSLQCTHGAMEYVYACACMGGEHNRATNCCSPKDEHGTTSWKLNPAQSGLLKYNDLLVL